MHPRGSSAADSMGQTVVIGEVVRSVFELKPMVAVRAFPAPEPAALHSPHRAVRARALLRQMPASTAAGVRCDGPFSCSLGKRARTGGHHLNAPRRSATAAVCSPNLAAPRARNAGVPVISDRTNWADFSGGIAVGKNRQPTATAAENAKHNLRMRKALPTNQPKKVAHQLFKVGL